MRPNLRRINVEVTNYCNYHCSICADKKERRVWFVDSELFDFVLSTFIAEKKDYGVDKNPEIRLFLSGEPSFHFDLHRFIEIAKKYEFPVLIHTNGSNWKKKLSDKIASIEHPNLTVSFSLDGGDKEKYAKIRGVDNFDKVVDNIKYFISVDNRTNKIVQCIVEPSTTMGVLHILEYYSTIFGNDVNYNVRHPHNWNIKNSVNGSVKMNYSPMCDFLFSDLVMYSDLQVGLCCACLNQEKVFGHILNDFDGSILKAFYRDDTRIKMRQDMENKQIIDVCSKCERYGIE